LAVSLLVAPAEVMVDDRLIGLCDAAITLLPYFQLGDESG
jgi:hypothetical protein